MFSSLDIIATDLESEEESEEEKNATKKVASIVSDYAPIFKNCYSEDEFDMLWDCYSDGIKNRIASESLNKKSLVEIKKACKEK